MSLRRPLLAATLAAILATGCTTWRETEVHAGWSLYTRPGESVELEEFRGAIEPAFAAVEDRLGAFESSVRIHAWNGGVEMQGGTRGRITTGDDGSLAEVPGIGPARVRAFHSSGDGGFLSPGGVFVGTADVGTSVHELVHARFAEVAPDLPLWFEEGYAMLLGDGVVHRGEWVVDGLACWPWRELREQDLDEAELRRLFELPLGADHSVRDNVLIHFLGWAVVFDLHRETGSQDWRELLALHESAEDPVTDAVTRLQRTLDEETPLEWLERLGDPDPGLRLATARGTWKLHSSRAQQYLLEALRDEDDPEVQACLAVNALATAGQIRLGRRQSGWMWRRVFPVLRLTELEDPDETSALRTLYRAYRYGNSRYDTQAALERLDRFWED